MNHTGGWLDSILNEAIEIKRYKNLPGSKFARHATRSIPAITSDPPEIRYTNSNGEHFNQLQHQKRSKLTPLRPPRWTHLTGVYGIYLSKLSRHIGAQEDVDLETGQRSYKDVNWPKFQRGLRQSLALPRNQRTSRCSRIYLRDGYPTCQRNLQA